MINEERSASSMAGKMRDRNNSLTDMILESICNSERTVFTQTDFATKGDPEAVEHALNRLMDDKELVAIGTGLFARVRRNRLNGEMMLAAPRGFHQVALEALNLLGVDWSPGLAETHYQTGGNQIPAQTVVKVIGNYKPDGEVLFQSFA